jgi:hypothetical protein
MKTFITLVLVLTTLSAIAGEVDSNCAQINDSNDRTSREVATSSSTSTDSSDRGATGL